MWVFVCSCQQNSTSADVCGFGWTASPTLGQTDRREGLLGVRPTFFFFLIIRLLPRGIEEGNETEIEGGQGMRLGGTDGETGSITADEIGLPRSPTRRLRSCLFVFFPLPLPPSRSHPVVCVHTCTVRILCVCCCLHLNTLHTCFLFWLLYCRGIKSFP